MSRLRFLSSTSVVFAAGAAAAPGCGDDSCGPGGAPDAGLIAGGGGVTLTYGGLHGGLNNDCPAPDAPAGVISLSIHGTQPGGAGLVTLCVGRPDLLAGQAQALGLDAGAAVRVIDLTGDANNCTFTIDRAQPATGSATSSGLCGNGSDAAGFALVLDGALSLTRTCGQTVDSLPITLHGRVAVTPDR
jgi:hypothetical protein